MFFIPFFRSHIQPANLSDVITLTYEPATRDYRKLHSYMYIYIYMCIYICKYMYMYIYIRLFVCGITLTWGCLRRCEWEPTWKILGRVARRRLAESHDFHHYWVLLKLLWFPWTSWLWHTYSHIEIADNSVKPARASRNTRCVLLIHVIFLETIFW